MTAIREHDTVILTRDIPEAKLRAGDVGVVIHLHRSAGEDVPVGYMLEIFSVDGASLDEVSVPADSVRAAEPTDRAAARPLAAE
jgi:hypothetical protein